jgi:hypothetical protein
VTHFSRQKKTSRGRCDPPRRGLVPPSQTSMHAHNVADTRASHANNITHTQHFPTCYFLCIQGVIGLHSQQSKAAMPMDPLHQENFSFLMNLQHYSKCPPSSTTLYFLQPCLSQSDIEYQYALSLNDKSGLLSLQIIQSNLFILGDRKSLKSTFLNFLRFIF